MKNDILKSVDAGDGASAGGADGVLQSAGLNARLKEHFGCAEKRLLGQKQGLVAGQARLYAAVCQSFCHQTNEGRTAARYGGAGIDELFVKTAELARLLHRTKEAVDRLPPKRAGWA